MFAKIENNVVVEYPIFNIYQRFPQTSFPEVWNDSYLPEGFVRVYESSPVVYNWATQTLEEGAPTFDGEKWVMTFNVVSLPQSEVDVRSTLKSQEIRNERNQLLSQTDWTQGKDIDDSISLAWAPYRQALRDVPLQEGFPFNVAWPIQP